MPLNFIVISAKPIYEEYSQSVTSQINSVKNCSAELDDNYSMSLTARLTQCKKQNKNAIAIGNSEVEHDMILLHFNDKSVRPKSMELSDFISLLESYEDDEDEEDDEDGDDESDDSSSGDILDMFVKSATPRKKPSNKIQPKSSKNNVDGQNEDLDEPRESANTDDFEIDCTIC